MKKETIRTLGFYNNSNAKLTLSTSTGRNLSANVLREDILKFIHNSSSVSIVESGLFGKYFHHDENGMFQYSNPTF